jgi:hypothetical protein
MNMECVAESTREAIEHGRTNICTHSSDCMAVALQSNNIAYEATIYILHVRFTIIAIQTADR